MSHIFISYARKNINFAQKIVNALAENDLDTWIDWKSIPKGQDWERQDDGTTRVWDEGSWQEIVQ
jgi:hypothetical protein